MLFWVGQIVTFSISELNQIGKAIVLNVDILLLESMITWIFQILTTVAGLNQIGEAIVLNVDIMLLEPMITWIFQILTTVAGLSERI